MREIKFRSWDKKEKKMCNESLMIGNIGLGEGSVIITEDVKKGNELIWMQFTGLKDKNGKEIFEGDIVIHKNGYKYIVEFSEINAKWCLVQPRKEDGNVLEGVYTGGIDGQDIWRCEVIGNIYENPELLEEEK